MDKFNIPPITLLAVVVVSMVVGAFGGVYAAVNSPEIEVKSTAISALKTCRPDTPKTEKCAMGVDMQLVSEKLTIPEYLTQDRNMNIARAKITAAREADGVIRFRPPHCGPLAHVVNHPKHGLLCVQNEGEWKNTDEFQSTLPPCTPPPGTPPGVLTMCAYSGGGKFVTYSASPAN